MKIIYQQDNLGIKIENDREVEFVTTSKIKFKNIKDLRKFIDDLHSKYPNINDILLVDGMGCDIIYKHFTANGKMFVAPEFKAYPDYYQNPLSISVYPTGKDGFELEVVDGMGGLEHIYIFTNEDQLAYFIKMLNMYVTIYEELKKGISKL